MSIYVGEQGREGFYDYGTFPGSGGQYDGFRGEDDTLGSGGGGSTNIRYQGDWIIAAGGGGGAGDAGDSREVYNGGYGGGNKGGKGTNNKQEENTNAGGRGGGWQYGGDGGLGYVDNSLDDARTISGNQYFPSPAGGFECGHSEDGYARITLIENLEPVTVSKDSEGYYNLTNEPLHYITFNKLSSYDGSPVSGAEFSLIGTSDSGTNVNKSAASGEVTGTVRFDNLEAGTYILQETKAPDGYDLNTAKYIVSMDDQGKYTIDGLNRNEQNIYELYDVKQQNKKITVTKVWDDGESHTDPNNDLAVTIQTNVPEMSTRKYQITFDANGGSFGMAG